MLFLQHAVQENKFCNFLWLFLDVFIKSPADTKVKCLIQSFPSNNPALTISYRNNPDLTPLTVAYAVRFMIRHRRRTPKAYAQSIRIHLITDYYHIRIPFIVSDRLHHPDLTSNDRTHHALGLVSCNQVNTSQFLYIHYPAISKWLSVRSFCSLFKTFPHASNSSLRLFSRPCFGHML
ncbi:hypothetical protein CW304_18245 [Bacillus sp. UFRGS-B20]|nr:hypothetical protein CW304_18245 [Bacillus sp. UFRGS-B20]